MTCYVINLNIKKVYSSTSYCHRHLKQHFYSVLEIRAEYLKQKILFYPFTEDSKKKKRPLLAFYNNNNLQRMQCWKVKAFVLTTRCLQPLNSQDSLSPQPHISMQSKFIISRCHIWKLQKHFFRCKLKVNTLEETVSNLNMYICIIIWNIYKSVYIK